MLGKGRFSTPANNKSSKLKGDRFINNTLLHVIRYVLFEGVCLTTVILAPGARKGGCELPAKSHFAGIGGIGRIP